ncbi:hypothetical protein D2T29_15840 [Sinirhodobacter populi]|uniref:Uncharacterized protein n=1 Tax=Paenirhodobacter populi TaxID=2306993 RepID=A0A443K7J0_9RHOB|nr:hypothetical protein [Sinirhodobacter populi]RWR28702.1 hypothetical protein D2T29_15840 [Sinirhodobacter populi]
MKFVLVQSPTVWWPVTVRVPDDATPGKMSEQKLKVQFVIRDRDQTLDRQEEYAALETERERLAFEEDDMVSIIRGWDGVVDGNGNPVPFSEEMLRAAWKKAWFRLGVNLALQEILLGKEAQTGN